MDVIESISNDSGICNHALHWDGYGANAKSASRQHVKTRRTDIYDGEFHTFGCEITEDKYIFYIDGNKLWSSPAAGVCKLDGYMKLTVEAADWAGARTKAAIEALPADMLVDYVKVWSAKPE